MSGPLFDLGLILNVLLEHRKGSAAHSKEAVGATPENWFPVVFLYVSGKLFPYQTRGNRLEIIDQSGRLGLRIKRHQKVDVISLTVKFEKLTIPSLEKSREVLFKPQEYLLVDAFATILSDQN